MAGGNDDGPAGLPGQDAIADDRRRRGSRTEIDPDAITGDNLGSGGSEVLGGEPGIVANDDAAPGQPCLFQVIGDALGAVPHVFEGKILSDNRPPAVSAEFDGIFSGYLIHPRFVLFLSHNHHYYRTYKSGYSTLRLLFRNR